jgi:PKD repeat protein
VIQTNPNTATGIKAAHTYSQAGQYKIKLTVTRGTKTAVAEKTVYVLPAQTELPAPWQKLETVTPSSSSSLSLFSSSSTFDPQSNGFSLNAYAEANQTVNHFVYQPLAGDGSILAKVQLAASSSSTAKAGLMLRQSNEVSSPFVFAYLQNSKVMVEYRDASTNQVATLEGGVLSALTEARFLKIERKEGSVYVYESGDGVTWRQITVLALVLAGSPNVGLVSDVSNGFAQVQFDGVVVQAQNNSDPNLINQMSKLIGSEVVDGQHKGGEIIIPSGVNCEFKFCDYAVAIGRGALKREATVTLKTLANRPSMAGWEAIGPASVVEVALDAIDIDKTYQNVFYIIAQPDPQKYKNSKNVLVEVSILLGDDTEYTWLDDYTPDFPTIITTADIDVRLKLHPNLPTPEIARITVLPVESKFFNIPQNNNATPNSNLNLSTLNLSDEELVATDSFYYTGLYHITPEYDSHTSCPQEGAQSLAGSDQNLSIPEGKTPLVLIHGWTLLSDYDFERLEINNEQLGFPEYFKNSKNLVGCVLRIAITDYPYTGLCHTTAATTVKEVATSSR